MTQQQEIEYSSFSQSLKESGINSRADAKALLTNIRKRALIIALVVIGMAAAIILFLPEMKVMVMIFAALPLIWLFSTNVKGTRFFRRYIAEQFKDTA